MKYFSTIRRVFGNCHNLEAEGDCFVNNNNGDNEHNKQRDLM
jgi:hypothetical protein